MQFYLKITIVIAILSVIVRGKGGIELKKAKYNYRITANDVYLIMCFAFFYVLSSIRDITVGRDTRMYRKIYSALGGTRYFDQISQRMQGYRGYRLLCRIVYLLFEDNYLVFNCITCAIILGLIYIMIKKYSMNYQMSVLLMLLMYMLYNSWNYSRQYCAIAIGTAAVVLLREKKLFASIVCLVIAITFHSTAAILFIIYILEYIKWNKRRFVFFSAIAVGGTAAFDLFVRIFLYLFPRFSYLYGKQFLNADFGSNFGGMASGRKSLVSILFLIILIGTMYLADGDCLDELWLFMAMTMISIVIGIVFRHYSAILRMQEYFNIASIVCIPNMIEVAIKNRILRILVNVCLCLIMLIPYYIQLSENYAEIIPYQVLMR